MTRWQDSRRRELKMATLCTQRMALTAKPPTDTEPLGRRAPGKEKGEHPLQSLIENEAPSHCWRHGWGGQEDSFLLGVSSLNCGPFVEGHMLSGLFSLWAPQAD